MSTIKEMREKQAKLVAESRTYLDEITDDTDEARALELETSYDAAMAEHDKLDDKIVREQKLLDAQAALDAPDDRRPNEDRRVENENANGPDHASVFDHFLRHGQEGMNGEQRSALNEMRAQSVGTNTAGGFTVPTGFSDKVIESFKAWGPMLDPGITNEMVTGSGNQIEIPTEDDTSNIGALLAENTQDSELDMAWGQKLLDAYKYTSKIIRVSEELLQDNEVNVEGRIAAAMGKRLGRIGNLHMTTGTGTNQPNGIMTAATVGVTAASNAAITFDELIDLEHSVDPAYRNDPSVKWMFADSTLKVIRKLKDANSNYIWQPANVQAGSPALLLGYDYIVNQDVAAIATVARTIAFGAFSAYIVRRIKEMAIKRLVERYADFYQVGFLGFARFDGDLMDTAAVKVLKHPI